MNKIFFAILACITLNTYAANMAYVEVNSNRFENAGCYIDAHTRLPFFQLSAIFAANINGSNPNSPTIFMNPQVTATLSSGQVQHLHQKGIKVLITLLGNHQNAGWACMTNETAAAKFADDVVNFVNHYGLDGVDIDDEYSKCETNNYSIIMMAKAIKAHPGFKGKLLTKALFDDENYFRSSYQGHKLSEYLDYGFEMTYFNDDFMSRLRPYLDAGMPLSKLMVGGEPSRSYPDPYEIGQFTAQNKLAGLMAFDLRNDSQRYLSALETGYSNYQDNVDVTPGCLK